MAKSSDSERDEARLVKALEDIKVRTGYMRTPNSMGWELKYAHEAQREDGFRQVVIATDRPVSFGMAASGGAYDAAFTLVEMRFPKGSAKGEGKLLGRAGISTKNGRLQLEIYTDEPARLSISEKNPKVKE